VTTARVEVYFIGADGARWRVYDCAQAVGADGRGHRRVLIHDDPKATYRVLVAEGGQRRSVDLTTARDRTLAADVLAAQLQRAVYGPSDPDASWGTPAPGRPAGG